MLTSLRATLDRATAALLKRLDAVPYTVFNDPRFRSLRSLGFDMPATTTVPKDTAKVLEDALTIINKKGWAKGRYTDSNGAVCLLQAITEANHTGPANKAAQDVVLRLVGTTSIPNFNDRTDVTKDYVILVLQAARNIALDLTTQ